MRAAIHVIHPYTYRLKGDTLEIGPVEEYTERDGKVTDFLKEALRGGGQVMLHLRDPPATLCGMLASAAFLGSPLDKIFSDKKLVSVVTSPQGLPVPDERPATIPEDVWEEIKRVYTTHSVLRDQLSRPKVTFFIGGALENCVASFVLYHHEHYRQEEPLFYVPELCASFDAEQWGKSEKLLQERDINPLRFEEALQELRK